MSLSIEIDRLQVRYGDTVAIQDLSLSLDGGKIYGLLGRNGSGKTSLLSILAGFRQPSAGSVRVDGAEPWENGEIMCQVCLIGESGAAGDGSVGDVLELAAALRPHWDEDYASRLLDRFKLSREQQTRSLSRGQRSALGVIVGLASRAPLTIFDESYLGMDAPSRYLFYDELLTDYIAHPRTFIISTHLIEEVSRLFEEVIIIDRERLALHEETESLLARGALITGPASEVDRFSHGMTVLNEKQLGAMKSVIMFGALTENQRVQAQATGVEISSVTLQDLFVQLTREGNKLDDNT